MARSVKQNAGVIGLGIIGSRVAANLRKAGYQTWVWNRTPRPEPNFLSSAAEVAESAKIIQVFVSDGPALLETVESMAPVLGPEHIVLNHATIAPKETLEAARIVTDRHANYLGCTFHREPGCGGSRADRFFHWRRARCSRSGPFPSRSKREGDSPDWRDWPGCGDQDCHKSYDRGCCRLVRGSIVSARKERNSTLQTAERRSSITWRAPPWSTSRCRR